MSLTPIGLEPSGPTLSYGASRRYERLHPFNVRGLLGVFLGGLLASAVAAFLAWLWYRWRLPHLLVIPMILQGLFVGLVLAFLCRWLRVRNTPMVLFIGIMCGFASAAFCQLVVYLDAVYELPRLVEVELWSHGISEGAGGGKTLLNAVRTAPFEWYDRIVIRPQGAKHRGFAGFMTTRPKDVYFWIGMQALIVAGIATVLGYGFAAQPFCETCGSWYGEPYPAIFFPESMSTSFTRAIEAEDFAALGRLVGRWHDEQNSMLSRVEVFRCRKCRRALLRVREAQAKLRVRRQLPLFYASEEMVQLLRSSVAVEITEAEVATSPPTDAPPTQTTG